MQRSFPRPLRSCAALFLALVALGPGVAPSARAAAPLGDCAPPRTRVALLPFADRTDQQWAAWSGENPARLVAEALADSLVHGLGREVLPVPLAPGDSSRVLARAADDAPALAAARHARAEVVLSGSVVEFVREDRREPSRLARWGMGAPDARSRARVCVTVRLLDARDGTVIIETTASRERAGRATASVSRPEAAAVSHDPLIAEALGEVLSDLSRTLGQRLDARWQARVLAEGPGVVMLDAGRARGLFAGERLDVFRAGIEVFDEDLVRLKDDQRVGAIVVVAFEAGGRARARLVEGDVRAGDRVRPCAGGQTESVSLRR